FIYYGFPLTYTYMNHFLITRTTSSKGTTLLSYLEIGNEWHLFTRKLVQGRYFILLLLSFMAWVVEYIMLKTLYKLLVGEFHFNQFISYINIAFLKGVENMNVLLYYYLIIGSLLFLVIMLVSYLVHYYKRGVVREKE